MPGMFLSLAGFIALNKDNLQDHLKATAGRSFKVDIQNLLTKISEIKNGVPKKISSIEQLVMKVASSKQTPITQTPNAIIMQEVDQARPEVQTPTYAVPEEVKSMAAMLTSNAGVAEFTLGKDTVKLGRALIVSELRAAGYNNVQIVVSSNTEDKISYAVAIDGSFGFTVPMKIKDGKPSLPEVECAKECM